MNLNKILKNSTPGKVAYIWHIERVKIDVIKFEKTQIHFLAIEVFTTVVVFVAYWSKWSRWDQIWIEAVVYCAFTYWRSISPPWFPRNSAIGCMWRNLAPFMFIFFIHIHFPNYRPSLRSYLAVFFRHYIWVSKVCTKARTSSTFFYQKDKFNYIRLHCTICMCCIYNGISKRIFFQSECN